MMPTLLTRLFDSQWHTPLPNSVHTTLAFLLVYTKCASISLRHKSLGFWLILVFISSINHWPSRVPAEWRDRWRALTSTYVSMICSATSIHSPVK